MSGRCGAHGDRARGTGACTGARTATVLPPLLTAGGGVADEQRERASGFLASALALAAGAHFCFAGETQREETHTSTAQPHPPWYACTRAGPPPPLPLHTRSRVRAWDGCDRTHARVFHTRAGFSRRAETRIRQAFFSFLFFTHPTPPPPPHRLSPARSRPRACPPSSWCWSATAARVRRGEGRSGGRCGGQSAGADNTHRPATEIESEPRAAASIAPFSRSTPSSPPHRQDHFCEAPPDGRV